MWYQILFYEYRNYKCTAWGRICFQKMYSMRETTYFNLSRTFSGVVVILFWKGVYNLVRKIPSKQVYIYMYIFCFFIKYCTVYIIKSHRIIYSVIENLKQINFIIRQHIFYILSEVKYLLVLHGYL